MIFQKICLLCLCAVVSAFFANAQQENINFSSISTKNGLSSNTVSAILKDRYGLIWFATEDGLNKFDGTNFTIYRQTPGDSSSLQANEILSLHEDKAGNLWIGTSGGSLSLYNRKKDTFINFPSGKEPDKIKNNVIRSLTSDHLGNIWIGHFSGMNILNPKTKQITRLYFNSGSSDSLFTKSVTYILEDSQRRIWIGTNEGLFQYNPKTKFLKEYLHSSNDTSSLSGNHVNAITEDKKGNLWIATFGGLSLLQPGKSSFINYSRRHHGNSLASNVISSIVADGDTLWLGTMAGLNLFNTRTGHISHFAPDPRDIHSLNAQAVRCIYSDGQGIYWLGTFGGGVNKYDKNLTLFNLVKSNVFDEQGLKASVVKAFAEDENGNVYVGTGGAGLSLFHRKTKLFQHFKIKSKRDGAGERLSILSMKMTPAGKLAIGTFTDGLFVFDPASGKYQQHLQGPGSEDLNNNDIYCISSDRKGNLWIGTNGAG
ncbi:MAG TPA: two-component regulator propeller domain-containing protein, partial [Chitinophagaceae bacterium]|nr:two-component regulator propeller domain-containing protein [Chitinophagaceae bacterium]